MLLITCPWCGPRDETEYHYGGQAHVEYPQDPNALTDEQWAQYLFFRDNTKGPFAERWVHSTGCRRWFNLIRNTATYEVLAVYRPDQAPPADVAALAGLASARSHASSGGATGTTSSTPSPSVPAGGSR